MLDTLPPPIFAAILQYLNRGEIKTMREISRAINFRYAAEFFNLLLVEIEKIRHFENKYNIIIRHCENWGETDEFDNINYNLPNIETFKSNVFMMVEELSIFPNLKRLSYSMTGIKLNTYIPKTIVELSIYSSPQFEFSQFTNLTKLSILQLNKDVESWPPNLRELSICYYGGSPICVKNLPSNLERLRTAHDIDAQSLPQSLKYLEVYDCERAEINKIMPNLIELILDETYLHCYASYLPNLKRLILKDDGRIITSYLPIEYLEIDKYPRHTTITEFISLFSKLRHFKFAAKKINAILSPHQPGAICDYFKF